MKLRRFTVEGSGDFPFDMLRYDRAWPEDTDDALKIGWTHERYQAQGADGESERPGRRSIVLLTYAPSITYRRWESFNWKVTAEAVCK